MRMQRIFAAAAAAVPALVLSGCHIDALGLHGCPTTYSDNWHTMGLDLEHTEPEDCPIYVAYPGEQRHTGAVIVDKGSRDAAKSTLIVYDADLWSVGSMEDQFGADPYNRWVAAVYPLYSAGRVQLRPDRADYFITPREPSIYPQARMTLTYTDQVQASIGGPGFVSSGTRVTYTANVITGSPPFTYRWYVNWTPVGTGSSSYSHTFWGSSRSEVRLEVIDSRGEAVSKLKFVNVSDCPSGQKTC